MVGVACVACDVFTKLERALWSGFMFVARAIVCASMSHSQQPTDSGEEEEVDLVEMDGEEERTLEIAGRVCDGHKTRRSNFMLTCDDTKVCAVFFAYIGIVCVLTLLIGICWSD